MSSCSRSSSLKPNRRRTGSARARSSTCGRGRATARHIEQGPRYREQRVGLHRRAVGQSHAQPMGRVAGVADDVAEPEARPRSTVRRCRCRGTSRARRAARAPGRRRAGRAAPRGVRRPGGRRRDRRAPGSTGRPGRGVRPAGRGSSAERSAWSHPSNVSGGAASGSSVSVAGSASASAAWSSRVSRPRLDSNGWRTAWWLSSAARSTAPRRPPSAAQSAGDGCGSQMWTSRSAGQGGEQVDLGHRQPGVAEQREPRREVERLGVLAQPSRRCAGGVRPATGRRRGRRVGARARAARPGRRRAVGPCRRCRGPRTSR